jgi:Gpi18-like mannosyltransferase
MCFLEPLHMLYWIVVGWRISIPALLAVGGIWLINNEQQVFGITILVLGSLAMLWGLLWTLERHNENE